MDLSERDIFLQHTTNMHYVSSLSWFKRPQMSWQEAEVKVYCQV